MEQGVSDRANISFKGKRFDVPAVSIAGVTVVSKGRVLRTAEIFDEYWLPHHRLPSPPSVIAELRSREFKADIFTFAQRVPNVLPAYDYYHEFDNYAVLPISPYDEWFMSIPAAARRNVRASAKRGIEIRTCDYDDPYVSGIMSMYNETPFRGGRRFWHYGKSFETVKAENGTYAEHSTFLAAFRGEEMVGYLKIVWDVRTAAIMQILSKVSVRECRPNNALMAEAVKQCCLRKVEYLRYEKFQYKNKGEDSLTQFKINNGFRQSDVPRYYVPLTRRGALALKLGLHKTFAAPEWIAAPIRGLRKQWYEIRHASK